MRAAIAGGCVFLTLTLSACSSSEPEAAKPSPFPAHVVAACPGLNGYGGDLGPVREGATLLTGFEGGREYEFQIADRPTSLPSELFSSRGNTCSVVVNATRSCMFMAKRDCHSLCQGRRGENDPDSSGRVFPLVANGCDPPPTTGAALVQKLDAVSFAKALAMPGHERGRSDNGRRRDRWHPAELDGQSIEIIGNDQRDADLIAWECHEFDAQGADQTGRTADSRCTRFAEAAMAQLVTEPRRLVQSLLSKSGRARATISIEYPAFSVETNGYFWFVRRHGLR